MLALFASVANAGLNAAQQQEAEARVKAAGAIVARYEAEATTNRYAADWKAGLMHMLLALPSASLEALASDRSLGTHRRLVQKARNEKARAASKALGNDNEDLVFIPITPCRLADTRFAGGPIAGGTARGFAEESGASQGGTAACSTALANAYPGGDAGAYAVNLTLVNMTTNGFAAIRPVGASEITSLVNFTGSGQQVNNFAIVRNANNAFDEFEVYVSATVDVIIDVFGIFGPPERTALDCYLGGIVSAALPDGAATSGYLYSDNCATGYVATGGGCYHNTSDAVYLLESGVSSNDLRYYCRFRNLSGLQQTTSSSVRCCRIPGR